jgi:nitronate monooxygenase
MNRLCALLGIERPVIQSPMAGFQGFELAAAVSGAGGLGSLPTATFSPRQVDEELRALRRATLRPWAVNFFCHRPPADDGGRAEQRWIAALSPWYAELGVAPPTAAGMARAPFSDELADLVEPHAPPVVSFHFGLPPPGLLARVRGWGAKVLSSATTVDEALWLQARGVDAVIAQGLQAGGHRGHFLAADHDLAGQGPTLELVSRLAPLLRVPVIAAGGIDDAEAARAAFARGAAAVQCGTAFLRSDEARTSALHRRALAGPQPRPTALTAAYTGRPARGLVNRWIEDSARVASAIPAFPLAAGAVAPLRAAAEAQGRDDFTALWAGEHVHAPRPGPAAALVEALAVGWPTQEAPAP